MKRIVMIHTSAVSLQDLAALCQEIVPEAEVFNIMDDSLLAEVKKNNGVTPGLIGRMCRYVQAAESLKPDLIFNQCSSVGEAFDIAARCTAAATLKMDQPMAEKAVMTGKRIGVIATVSSTVKPSCALIRSTAERLGRPAEVQAYLVRDALEILMREKDTEKHNRLVLEAIERAAMENDVVVLAQGSMITLLPYLESVRVPVLTSPRLAVERIREMLESRAS